MAAAVEAAPEDVSLRLHFAELLAERGLIDDAVRHAAVVLQREPQNGVALNLVVKAATTERQAASEVASQRGVLDDLEAELAGVLPPRFADDEPAGEQNEGEVVFDAELSGVRLADVGGMAEVKARLESAVLAPIRNPELVRLYGKSLRGGMLLYGPPGCGKTFIARALAGEMDARFISVSLADVLDMFVGQSERNVRGIFDAARGNAPCVVFLDEVDALGHKRSQQRYGATRGTVNQLLAEMDGVASANDGVFVLGATNHPWDVDVALRRPGRFDRMVLVTPPDAPAREVILRYHLRGRPIANIDTRRLAKRTDGYSGADLAYVCEVAAEKALVDSARSGSARLIDMRDLESAVAETRPSVEPWFDVARNVALFANEGGAYDELRTYLKDRKRL
jgi:SpoVK/Ycf46/Vps4 family AAA+-type ATPase